MTRWFWVLLVAAVAVQQAMTWWSAPYLASLAGGETVFDLRITGYDFETAHRIISDLGAEGRRFYLEVQLLLDSFFPALYGAVLVLLVRWVFPGWLGAAAAVYVVAEVACDYLENAAVAEMLRAGPDGLTVEMVAAASRWTVLKSGMAALGLTMLIVGLLRKGWLSWRKAR